MKTKNFFLSALCVLTLGMLASCKKAEQEPTPGKDPEPTYAEKPFEKVSLQAEGETVEGVVTDLSIAFKFEKAENFTQAKLIITVNEGWKLVYPTDPDNYDVSSDPDLYFTDPEGKKHHYTVTITSNALPIVDGSKVSVEGGYAISYNVAAKAFVITYQEGMDRSKITLIFAEGALMEGAEVVNPTLDLSEGPAELVIKAGATEKSFPVSIDYTAALGDFKAWGFDEVTTEEQKAKIPSLTVLNALSLKKQVPQFNSGAETQSWWDNSSYEDQIAKMGLLGDYTADRAMIDMPEVDFTIVTFNERDLKGKIISDAEAVKSGKAAESVSSLITMSGCPATWTCWVKSEGTIVSWESAAWWEGVKAKGTSHGLCFGFDADGKLALKHIVPEANIFHAFSDFRKASDFGFNYNERLTDDNFAPFRNDFTLTGEDWAVTGCAYFTPALVVDGYKVRFADVMANNGDTEVVGQGFNGTRTRCYIGRTIDNKIGLATINVKKMNIMQGAYVLADLGWTDVYYVGGDNWQSDSFQPTIVIDGKVVSGQEGQMAKYVIAFDAK